jgi:hypothetical protein
MQGFWKLGLVSLLVVGAAACRESDAADTTVTVAEATTTALPAETVSDETAAGEVDSSCAFEFSEAALAERSWAFDGTLVAV